MWYQKTIRLNARTRGFHLITDEIVAHMAELQSVKIGRLNLFIQHTSASLTINENADSSVRGDFETWANSTVPESFPGFVHTYEGPDDMPAHIKASLFGPSLDIPVTNGALALGTWQGIYLCEHRNHGGSRSIVLTLNGC